MSNAGSKLGVSDGITAIVGARVHLRKAAAQLDRAMTEHAYAQAILKYVEGAYMSDTGLEPPPR